MTVSTHVYSARLVSPSTALSVRGGRLSFDETRAPHVQASIEIVTPSLATLAALDTRMSPPPRVQVTAVNGAVTRVFNLTLRDRDVRHADGVTTLTLASDEALLEDYAPLADDAGAFAFQSSLRSVVNYVLGKVIPGRTLTATPALDADVTTYSDAANLFPDPRYARTAGGGYDPGNVSLTVDTTWVSSQGVWGAHLSSPSNNDGYLNITNANMPYGVQVGKTYVFSAAGSVRGAMGGTENTARSRRLVVIALVNDTYQDLAVSPKVPTTVETGASAGTRVSVEFTIPPGTTAVIFRAYHGHTSGAITWRAFRLTEKSTVVGTDPAAFFSGATPDTAGYLYEWDGTTDASTSRRTALIDRAPESLLWKAGQAAIDFLLPIVQAAGLRLVCDEQRRFTLRNEEYFAADSISIRHGVNLIDGTDRMSRADETWFDAAVTTYTWTALDGTQQTAVDTFSLNPSYTRLQTFERLTPYPGPGFSAYAVRRAQGRGREVSATAVADWRANAEQPITVVLEGAPTQIGQTSRVEFDLSTDRMTVNTRTTDTPFGAIDLLTGTIDQLAGTIDNL